MRKGAEKRHLADFQEKPLAFDDVLVRKTIVAIHVLSKDEIEITFVDGQKRRGDLKKVSTFFDKDDTI